MASRSLHKLELLKPLLELSFYLGCAEASAVSAVPLLSSSDITSLVGVLQWHARPVASQSLSISLIGFDAIGHLARLAKADVRRAQQQHSPAG